MRMKKHIGVLSNTSTRVAVVFRTVPNETSNCLVVETDRLPDALQTELTHVLDSKEAGETNDLFQLLNRRTFNNGTNMLTHLHTAGFLRKVPVEQVMLEPIPGNRVSLSLVNEQIDGPSDTTKSADVAPQAVAEPTKEAEPGVAEGLLVQAQLLEEEAEKKRQEAYAIDPSLAHKKKGRPELSPEEKAQREVEKKQKRLERDRENARKRKAEKAEAELNAAVAEKIARDQARAEGNE